MGIKTTVIFICTILSFSALSNPDTQVKTGTQCKLTNLTWLLGVWTDKSGKTKEAWKKVSTATFEGEGAIKQDGQWVTYESLRLVEMSGELFFVAKVGHNLLPVAFKVSQCDKNGVSFANPLHDFPKELTYKLTAKNQIAIEVKGADEKGFNIYLTKQ
jgi:hypothetical protein